MKKNNTIWYVIALIAGLFLASKISAQTVTEIDTNVYTVSWLNMDVDSIRYDPDREFRLYSFKSETGWISYQLSDTFKTFYPTEIGDIWYCVSALYPDRGAKESPPSDTVIARIVSKIIPPPPTEFTILPHKAKAWSDLHNHRNGWQGHTSLLNGAVGIAKGDSVWKRFAFEGGTYLLETSIDSGIVRIKFGDVDTVLTLTSHQKISIPIELELETYYLKYVGISDFTAFGYGLNSNTIIVSQIEKPREAGTPGMIWIEKE